jgi:hypothetical protein
MKVFQIFALVIIFSLLAGFSSVQAQDQKIPNHLTPDFRPAQPPMSSELKEEMTPEMIDQFIIKIAETDPNQAAQLKNLRKNNPEEFKKALAENMKQHRTKYRDRIRQRYEQHLEWLKENYPAEANEMAELKTTNPDLYIEKMTISMKKYQHVKEAQDENDIALADVLKKEIELNRQQYSLIKDIKVTANDQKKQELMTELKDVLGQKYDVIVQRKQMAYEKLLKKIEDLKLEIKKSKDEVEKWKDPANKEKNIEEKLKKTFGKDQKFEWDSQ